MHSMFTFHIISQFHKYTQKINHKMIYNQLIFNAKIWSDLYRQLQMCNMQTLKVFRCMFFFERTFVDEQLNFSIVKMKHVARKNHLGVGVITPGAGVWKSDERVDLQYWEEMGMHFKKLWWAKRVVFLIKSKNNFSFFSKY